MLNLLLRSAVHTSTEDCSSVGRISYSFSVLSLTFWLIAQLPQQIKNYKLKSVDAISPFFLLNWFLGDFFNFLGCILTDQLPFQLYISIYYLCNDVILLSQFFYYGYYLVKKKNNKAETRCDFISNHNQPLVLTDANQDNNQDDIQQMKNELNLNKKSIPIYSNNSCSYLTTTTILASSLASTIPSSSALPINKHSISSINDMVDIETVCNIGIIISWLCTASYITSRMPQLYKNYQRKSTNGLSPLLFGSALMGNLTYTLSILTSCTFLSNPNNQRWDFFKNELPFILGSGGTIIFDIIFFYQTWYYNNSKKFKNNNSGQNKLYDYESVNETTPLNTHQSASLL
ncbi:Ypq2p ASCRUDRAFT_77250 [Ascoidea rubescens DSM 1968]|uniref:PQ-loop-domain-containing protein n=1 Tax=Ascoidea rubescens DSM 1968 TaxID=1344418 RepID=A0A1D2VBZ3_9ASCO|nr:hypothetical protein ASCRUDRAFT_77250 [Ascoidea rubescens DSM 1968]ODV59156.1 hypothetical protein ASCRUDRAFT_77250 [Ascoidea rubescens DSM 1968]